MVALGLFADCDARGNEAVDEGLDGGVDDVGYDRDGDSVLHVSQNRIVNSHHNSSLYKLLEMYFFPYFFSPTSPTGSAVQNH